MHFLARMRREPSRHAARARRDPEIAGIDEYHVVARDVRIAHQLGFAGRGLRAGCGGDRQKHQRQEGNAANELQRSTSKKDVAIQYSGMRTRIDEKKRVKSCRTRGFVVKSFFQWKSSTCAT